MAEQQTVAAPEAPSEAHEAEGTESAVELRDALVERLKTNRAARAAGTEDEPAKPKKAEKPAKPKRGEPAAAKPEVTAGADDAADESDPPELAKLKAERRGFAKHKRKWEAQAQARESQLVTIERQAKQHIESFEKDPIAWLKARKVDVRATLLRMANEDSEDPRDRKLRELEEKQNRTEQETKRERAEREEREAKVAQRQAVAQIETEMGKAWKDADVDDYPTVATALEPEHVSQRAAEIMVEHYREWVDGGQVGRYKELAPSAIFAIMEDELAPLKGKLANPKKGKPPEQVRAASAPRKAASPETPTKRERSSSDVTRSASREPTLGRPQNFSKESLRERLIERVKTAAQ
jgi:hypothetical protein